MNYLKYSSGAPLLASVLLLVEVISLWPGGMGEGFIPVDVRALEGGQVVLLFSLPRCASH